MQALGWKKYSLGELGQITSSKRIFKNEYVKEGVPFYRTKEVKELANGNDIATELFIKKERFDEIVDKFGSPKEGDILLTAIGTIGEIYVVEGNDPFYFKDGNVLWLKDFDSLDEHFLRYALMAFVDELRLLSRGSAYNALPINKLKNYEVFVPPIPEQKRIVAILDQAFADIEQARAKTEQNLKNARELFESYLQQVFSQRGEGWVEKGLKDVSLEFGRGKSKHRPRNHESLYGGDYPFIQTGDVRNCEHVITNYSKTYNEKGLAQSKLWPKGTICITIAANIAETGILDFEGCFPDSVIGVVVNPKVTTIRYVEYLLQSFKTILKAKGQGSAQDNINMGTFEKMVFPFPSIDKQDEIVNSLDGIMSSVQKLERIYSDKLKSIDELKKSILQKAFSGELSKDKEGVAA